MSKKLIYLTPNEASRLSTKEILFEIRSHLHNTAQKLWKVEPHYKISEKIEHLINKKTITWENIASCWENLEPQNPLITEKESRTLKTHFTFASLYYKKAYIKSLNDDEKSAINLAAYASYHIGALDNQAKLIRERIRDITRAQSGGNGKAAITKTVTDKLIELLKTPPPTGWESASNAVRILAPILETFIISNKYGKIIHDTAEFILNKIEERGKTKTIFKKHQHQQI